jgi:hypothetical protein
MNENQVCIDSSNYRGSHLAGKPGRQWRILVLIFLISLVLVGSIFVPPMTLAIIDKGLQAA